MNVRQIREQLILDELARRTALREAPQMRLKKYYGNGDRIFIRIQDILPAEQLEMLHAEMPLLLPEMEQRRAKRSSMQRRPDVPASGGAS
jgi:hypothetical protein